MTAIETTCPRRCGAVFAVYVANADPNALPSSVKLALRAKVLNHIALVHETEAET